MSMSHSSRYPRLIPSFVEKEDPCSQAHHNDVVSSKVRGKLEALVEPEPFKRERLASTIQGLLEERNYRLLCCAGKTRWHSFNGLTGSWFRCERDLVAEAAHSLVQQKAVTVLRQLERIERKVASSDTARLTQLLREWLHARTKELTAEKEIQKALSRTEAVALPNDSTDAFATSCQGCFEVDEGEGWRRLSDEEAAQRMQTTFVSGKIPAPSLSRDATPAAGEVALFCQLFGRALYRDRYPDTATVVQAVGERTDQLRSC